MLWRPAKPTAVLKRKHVTCDMGHKYIGSNRFVRFIISLMLFFCLAPFSNFPICELSVCVEAISLLIINTNNITHSTRQSFVNLKPSFCCFSHFVKGSVNFRIGATGMNVFLTLLNIPWKSKKAYKYSEDEERQGILPVTEETCRNTLKRR